MDQAGGFLGNQRLVAGVVLLGAGQPTVDDDQRVVVFLVYGLYILHRRAPEGFVQLLAGSSVDRVFLRLAGDACALSVAPAPYRPRRPARDCSVPVRLSHRAPHPPRRTCPAASGRLTFCVSARYLRASSGLRCMMRLNSASSLELSADPACMEAITKLSPA